MNVTKLSLKYPHDEFGLADGAHDTDSIGLYQQRPAWGWGNYGSSTGITDPEGAVQRLLDPRWEAMAFFGGPKARLRRPVCWTSTGGRTWPRPTRPRPCRAAPRATSTPSGKSRQRPTSTTTGRTADRLPWFPGGGGGALACTSIPTDPKLGEAGHNPMGYLDSATLNGAQIRVAGWTLDPDAINGTVSVRVADTGTAGFTQIHRRTGQPGSK